MFKRFVIFAIIFAVIHFCITMVTIYNGFIIFRAPTTTSEIFWTEAMNIMLFPANILFQGSGNKLEQTLAIIFNSLVWGSVFSAVYLILWKKPKRK